MKRKRLIGFIATLLVFQSVNAQKYSITEAVDYALKNNKKVDNADFEIEKANQKVKQTFGIGLPNISAEGTFNHFLDIATTVAPAQAFNPFAGPDDIVELQFGTEFNMGASLTVSQLIFDGSFLVGLQTAKKFKNVSALQKQKTELDIKEAVTKAYYSVLVSSESITTLEDLLKTSQKMYDDTKIIFEEGLIEEDNLDQLNLSVLNTKNAISSAKKQLELAETMLKYEMGLDLNSTISLTSSFKEVVSQVQNVNTDTDLANNLDVQLLNTQVELNQLGVKYEKSRGLPSLGAFFSHQQNAFRNDFDFFENKPWYPTTIWGLKLSIPVWSGGQQKALVNQAKLTLKQSENELKLVEDGLSLQLKNAKTAYDNAKEAYEVQQEAVETAKKIYDRYQIKYKEGVVSSMELTQAQSQYVSSESQYIQAMYNLINTKLQLDKLSNKL